MKKIVIVFLLLVFVFSQQLETDYSYPKEFEISKSNILLMKVDPAQVTTTSIDDPENVNGSNFIIIVKGNPKAAQPGSEIIASIGESSASTKARNDGSFEIKIKTVCKTSFIEVNIVEKVNGVISEPITKGTLCFTCCAAPPTSDEVFNTIAGKDGVPTLGKVLDYISTKGGLAIIVVTGGSELQGLIKAIKVALGLS